MDTIKKLIEDLETKLVNSELPINNYNTICSIRMSLHYLSEILTARSFLDNDFINLYKFAEWGLIRPNEN